MVQVSRVVFLNDEFLPIEQAKISVLDRGFIFGDGVYEVIPVYSRHAFRLDEHLDRLQSSLDAIRLTNPYSREKWSALIADLVSRNDWDDQYVYLQVTRGVAERDHAFPSDCCPTVFISSTPLTRPSEEVRQRGVSAITVVDNRWLRCDIKATSLLPNVLLRQQAIEAGATEAIMLREGFLTEGAASNIFVVKDGRLLAPPKNHLMLPGITYDVVLELAAANEVPVEVREISEYELRTADEVWLTSSTKEILPITVLDGKPVGDGKPGSVFHRLYAFYQEFKADVMRAPERGQE